MYRGDTKIMPYYFNLQTLFFEELDFAITLVPSAPLHSINPSITAEGYMYKIEMYFCKDLQCHEIKHVFSSLLLLSKCLDCGFVTRWPV